MQGIVDVPRTLTANMQAQCSMLQETSENNHQRKTVDVTPSVPQDPYLDTAKKTTDVWIQDPAKMLTSTVLLCTQPRGPAAETTECRPTLNMCWEVHGDVFCPLEKGTSSKISWLERWIRHICLQDCATCHKKEEKKRQGGREDNFGASWESGT